MKFIRSVTWLVLVASVSAQQTAALRSPERAAYVARLSNKDSAPEAIDELVAMGARALPVIEEALRSDPVARRSAFLALDQLGREGLPSWDSAADVVFKEADQEVTPAGFHALGTLALHAEAAQILSVTGDPWAAMRRIGCTHQWSRLLAIADQDRTCNEAELIRQLRDEDVMKRWVAAELLVLGGTAAALPALHEALRSRHEGSYTVVFNGGRGQGCMLSSGDFTADVNRVTARAIVRLEPGREPSALAHAKLLGSPFRRERIDAAMALTTLSTPPADRQHVGDAIDAALATQDRAVLRHLIVAAGTFGLHDGKALKRLRELAAGEDHELAAIAAATLKRLPAK